VRSRSALRAAVAVAAAASSVALVVGCESIFGIGSLPFPADGGGADTSEPDVAVVDSGMDSSRSDADAAMQTDAPEVGPPACTPTVPFTQVKWAGPSAFPQSACTATQVSAYLTCFPNCDTFRQDLANAACVSCIETDENAIVHGPVVTRGTGSQAKPVLVNVGGCLAHFDGMSAPGGCGNQEDDLLACDMAECGSCSDFSVPAMSLGPTDMCEQMASGGTCQADTVSPSCAAELQSGSTAACSSLAGFLPQWCAPPPVTPPSCYAGTAFTPLPWAAPTAFGQGMCTTEQISAYESCFQSNDCSAFRADPSNSGCLGCIETDESSFELGPIVTSGGVAVEVNFGGCQAHFDNETTESGCGNLENEFTTCAEQECGTCSDFGNPTSGGPSAQCEGSAFTVDGGACTPYNDSMTLVCNSELADGGVAGTCDNFFTFLPLWCGQ